MEHVTREQVYHILQNLSNLEISYTDYTRTHINYEEYQTYFDYFNNYVIRSHNLMRFYFATPLTRDMKLPKTVTEVGAVPEGMSFLPGHDITAAKNFNFPGAIRHRCEYDTLIYIMEGSGSLTLDEQQFTLKEGDFYFIPAMVYYTISTNPESICICLNIRRSYLSAEYKNVFLDDARLNAFFVESLQPDSQMRYLAIHTDNSQTIRNRALDIFAEYINQYPFSDTAMKNYLALLMTSILRNPATEIESSVAVSYTEQQYQLICEYLKQNTQTASLTDISERLHYSKQYVCKIVKSISGKTFQTLLMERRLEMVRQYLEETSLPLETVSELCGFSTAAHLSRCFKNAFGVPPSTYRQNAT